MRRHLTQTPGLRPEEAPGAYRRFGNPDGAGLKNGALFESFDRGRTFALHGTSQYYGHRGFVMFAPTGEVVVAHSAAGFLGSEGVHGRKVARISLA
jgi:hypothetical protein